MVADAHPAYPTCGCSCALQADALQVLLSADDLDAAIEAGLMAFVPCPDCLSTTPTPSPIQRISDAQRRLRRAWDARDRYLARQQRLQRRAAERDAKRRQASGLPANNNANVTAVRSTALPPAAAALLARAKAKAAQRNPKP